MNDPVNIKKQKNMVNLKTMNVVFCNIGNISTHDRFSNQPTNLWDDTMYSNNVCKHDQN